MPPDERRAAIIAAARPLVAVQGANVTTAQIAEAAGIAEGTLFRVFASKAEIVAAVIGSALDTAPMVAWVESHPEPTLEAQARAILVELQRAYAEVSAMFAALFTMGQEGQAAAKPPAHDHAKTRADHLRLRDAVATSLASHAADLRIPTDKAASLLIGLVTISSHGLVSDGSLTDPDEIVDLFLHGTSKDPQ